MTLFEGEQNGRYETDHLHMVLNEHIDFTEEGLSVDILKQEHFWKVRIKL